MVVTAEHRYAGHRLHAGQEYDCEKQHVELMQKLGWAKPVEEPGERSASYNTRVMTARGRGK